MTSASAGSLPAARLSCPGCGTNVLETLVSSEEVAEEIELRRAFFHHRIDGVVSRPERKDTGDVFHGGIAEIAICRRCEILLRIEPSPPATFEDDAYEAFVMERMLRAHIDAYRRKERLYRPLLPAGARVIEVGSYIGGFLQVAAEWQWDAVGVDIGGDTSHFSSAHGQRTLRCSLEACHFPNQSFEGLFAWNCFEQLADPHAFLAESRRIVRPGGVLLIRTPNALLYAICEALLRVRRAQPHPLDDHDPIVIVLGHANLLGFPHLFGFSERALDCLARAHGFSPERHLGDGHIDPRIRPMTPDATREEERVNAAIRILPPWLEATYRG